MAVNLFISLYSEKDKRRSDELHLCLMNNLKSGCFNAVWVIAEDDGEGLKYLRDVSPYTINVLPCTVRPTFRTFYEAINMCSQRDDINVIANSDIYFKDFPIVPKYNECLALTRYEEKRNGATFFVNRKDCTDTWIFYGHIKMPNYSDHWLGVPGCDNRQNFELKEAGYTMLNPSLTFKTFHVHEGEKSYDGSIRVNRPYHFIVPTE